MSSERDGSAGQGRCGAIAEAGSLLILQHRGRFIADPAAQKVLRRRFCRARVAPPKFVSR